MPLIIKGRIIPLAASDPNKSFAGRVFLNDAGTIGAAAAPVAATLPRRWI